MKKALTKLKILVIGSTGQLGEAFARILSEQGFNFSALGRNDIDLTNHKQVEKVIKDIKPDIIINCAAYTLVDDAEDNSGLAYKVNQDAVKNLAEICKKLNIFLVHYSTDYVFKGDKKQPYTEKDPTCPINVYGKSKLEGELAVKNTLSDYLIFRVSWVIGRSKRNILYRILQWAKGEGDLRISSDEISALSFVDSIVMVTLLSLKKSLTGLYHLTSSNYASRYKIAKYFLSKVKPDKKIIPVLAKSFDTKANRPAMTAMSNKLISSKLNIVIPGWKEVVDKFIEVLKNGKIKKF